MNLKRMLKQNIKLNLEQYSAYIFSMIISVIFFFIESTLYNSYTLVIGMKNVFVLPSIAVFGTALWSIFTYISFIRYRQNEFIIFLNLGLTINELKILILIENISIFLIYVPIGLTLGIIFSKIIVLSIFKLAGISIFTFQLKSIVYITTVGNYILLNVILTLWAFKFIDNLPTSNIMNEKNLHITYFKKEKLLKTVLLILSIGHIYFTERIRINYISRYYIDYLLICTAAIYILFLILIKLSIILIKKNKNFYFKRILIVNEINDSLEENKIIIFFISFLNLIFIISERLYDLPNVKTLFNTYSIFRGSCFNLIYIFIMLLSFIASANILHFKTKIDFYIWKPKKIRLYNIGLIKEEIDILLTYKLRIVFFSHVFLTTLISVIYIFILNININFMINTVKILLCYFFIQLLGYAITKQKLSIFS